MFMGLSISNWMIWIIMAFFIIAYFTITETVNCAERDRESEDEH